MVLSNQTKPFRSYRPPKCVLSGHPGSTGWPHPIHRAESRSIVLHAHDVRFTCQTWPLRHLLLQALVLDQELGVAPGGMPAPRPAMLGETVTAFRRAAGETMPARCSLVSIAPQHHA